MKKYLELTELENALDYLEKAFYFIKEVEKNNTAWKWIILSIHSALYGFEISALKKMNYPNLLHEESNKSRTKFKQKILAYRNSLQLTSSQKKSIEKIENFRKKIEYYDPTIWNIEPYILMQTVIDILNIIKLIALERKDIDLDQKQIKQVEFFICESINLLKNTTIYEEIEKVSGKDIILSEEDEIYKEILLLEEKIKKKEKQISDLSLVLEDIKIKLSIFENEYNAKVGILYVELDKIDLEIKQYKYRIKLVKEKLKEKKTLTPEDLEEIENIVMNRTSAESKKVSDLEEEVSESTRAYEEYLEEEKIPTNEEFEKELKNLYRNLTMKYHPDKITDEEKKKEYNKIMCDINEAYRKKDLETLRKYARQIEEEEKIEKETLKEKLERLKNKDKLLSQIILNLKKELKSIKESETYKFMKKVETSRAKGTDPLQQLADELKKRIKEREDELTELKYEYDKIIEDAKGVKVIWKKTEH